LDAGASDLDAALTEDEGEEIVLADSDGELGAASVL